MVAWHSAEVEEACFNVFKQISAFGFGVYIWHFLLTLREVECELACRRLQFSLSHVPYLAARYFQLVAFILLLTFLNTGSSVLTCNHAKLMRCIFIFANLALAASTTNLGFRAFMIWRRNLYVCGCLVLRCLTHWVLAVHLGVSSAPVPSDAVDTQCTIDMTLQPEAVVFFLYTVLGNAILLAFTVFGLHREYTAYPRASPLLSVLLTHSVVCLCVGCLTCVPVAIMLWLNLNPFMNMLLAPLANTVSVITSSSAVISLMKMKMQESSATNHTTTSFDAKRPRPFAASHDATGSLPPRTKDAGRHELTTHIGVLSSVCWTSRDLESAGERPDTMSESTA